MYGEALYAIAAKSGDYTYQKRNRQKTPEQPLPKLPAKKVAGRNETITQRAAFNAAHN